MPSNIDFLLDELYVDESYVVSGNTEPSILGGLFGNVTFEPWTDFRRIIEDSSAVVEQFAPQQLAEVNASLHKARRFISQARKDHLMSLEIERKRKAEHDIMVAAKSRRQSHASSVTKRVRDMEISEIHEGPTAVFEPPTNEGRSLNPNNTADADSDESRDREDSSSSEEEAENWRVELPVNTSSSILDLHKDVSDVLKELLRIMYPDEILRLDLKTISSEALFQEKRRKMLHKYMLKIINDENASKNTKVPPSDASVESNTQSEAVQGRADAAIVNAEIDERPQEESQGPLEHRRGEAAGEMDNEENMSLQSGVANSSTPLRRSARIREKSKAVQDSENPPRSVLVPIKPVFGFTQTPDRALFRIADNDRGAVPVCCYEFKAPALDLSGLLASKASGDQTHVHAFRGQTTNGQRSSPESVPNDLNSHNTGSIQGSNENRNEDDLYIPGLSARTIASEYDRLFKNPQHMNKRKTQFASERLVLLPIAQVICQALLSKTGCVFLTNHQMSFALRVEENQEKFGARVFVTGAIPSNQAPGQIAAMLGFTKYCMDKVKFNTERSLLDPQRRLVTSLSYKAYDAEIDTSKLDPDWCPLGKPQGRGQGDSGSARRQARNRDFGTPETESTDNALGYESAVSTPYLARAPISVCHKTDVKLLRSAMDERLKTMFATTEGLLGVGASGIIVRGVWDGRKVAIKMWNGQTREGFLSIRREIKNYDRLQSRCPFVLGCAVPGYVLGWDRPEEFSVYRKELILITELVGEGIVKKENGRFWIDTGKHYEKVKSVEVPLICDAALSSLLKLHEQGFLHGDIALRNVRVMKTPESDLGWKVWWVDLGDTSEVNCMLKPMLFELEKRKCLALFRNKKRNQRQDESGQLTHRSSEIKPAGSVAVM